MNIVIFMLTITLLLSTSCGLLTTHPPDWKEHDTSTEKNGEASDATKLSSLPSIGIIDNDLVRKWTSYFTQRDKNRFQIFLERGLVYKDVVQTILKENNLPIELYYLALIESGYSNHAYSTAHAVGAWQFMKGTAKNYRLQVNQYVDERRDPIRATEAASKYLADLYTVFQSWELALSAYNCGENRVLRAIMQGKDRDFWVLSNKGLLPKQTQNYVPKFMAAIMLGENPEEYGLMPPSAESYPSVELVEVPSPIALSKVAELANIPLTTLEKVNPHLLQGITPPYQSSYEIWVPEESVVAVNGLHDKLAEFRSQKVTALPKDRDEESRDKFYTVKKGDNLSHVANRFGISLAYLRNLNGLKNNHIWPGQRLRIKSTSYHPVPLPRKQYYFVKKGQSLSSIARHHNTTPSAIRKLNDLKENKVHPGQRLKLPNADKSNENKKQYTIQKGDSLSKIARQHGIKLKDLRKANNIFGQNTKLKPGQQIIIP